MTEEEQTQENQKEFAVAGYVKWLFSRWWFWLLYAFSIMGKLRSGFFKPSDLIIDLVTVFAIVTIIYLIVLAIKAITRKLKSNTKH